MPSSCVYRYRFGSLLKSYCLVGYTPQRDYQYVAINRQLRRLHPVVVSEIVLRLGAVSCTIQQDPDTDLVVVNSEYSLSVVLARCKPGPRNSARWLLRFDQALAPDITIAVRMNIARSDDAKVQKGLREAYESGKLSASALAHAMRMVEARSGKAGLKAGEKDADKPRSANDIVRVYRKETVRQKALIEKNRVCEGRLRSAISGLKKVFLDDNFVTLLRAEGLDSLPKPVADHINPSTLISAAALGASDDRMQGAATK